MLDAVDKAYKTYNEGRLAFRQYFATYSPNVKQNDPKDDSRTRLERGSRLTRVALRNAPSP